MGTEYKMESRREEPSSPCLSPQSQILPGKNPGHSRQHREASLFQDSNFARAIISSPRRSPPAHPIHTKKKKKSWFLLISFFCFLSLLQFCRGEEEGTIPHPANSKCSLPSTHTLQSNSSPGSRGRTVNQGFRVSSHIPDIPSS